SRRRHTRSKRDWSSDVCSSDLSQHAAGVVGGAGDGIGIDEGDLKACVLEFKAGGQANDAATDDHGMPFHVRNHVYAPALSWPAEKSVMTCCASSVAEGASRNARTIATPAMPVVARSATS